MATRQRKRRKPAPSMVQLRRKTALYQHGLTQQMVADEVEKETGTKVSRQAVGFVTEGRIRSRRIEKVYARLVELTPEALGWPHAKEDAERAAKRSA